MGTEIVYRVKTPNDTLGSTLRIVSRILATGHQAMGLTLDAESRDLENLAKAHRMLQPHAEELQSIVWRHEWPSITLTQARHRVQRLLAWALRAPCPATAVVRLECRLSSAPGYRHTIGYLQNENWQGTLDLPSGGPPGSPRETGVRLLGVLGFHHLAVAYPTLDAQSLQGMEIRSDADQANLRILGISGGHPTNLLVTPFRREKAVLLFRRLLREDVERTFGCSLQVGGYPEAAKQAHRERLVPLRSADFSAVVRRLTPGLVRRVAARSDQVYARWSVDQRPNSAIRWFDVRLSKTSEEGYFVEVLSRDFWQTQKVERLGRLWQVKLEHVGEE